MNSTITITPIDNIKNHKVLNEFLITKETYNTHTDELLMKNKKEGEIRLDTLINVSLYDDLIIKDETEYKILSMFTK
jgi:hypothetical protein